VAIIDSGITTWHDDLTNKTSKLYPYGNQRVSKFVDFVNAARCRMRQWSREPRRWHHRRHGYDSQGEKTGIAPGANLVSLKVLDQNGQGTISNIIAALGWVAANASTYNIRVVNMSAAGSHHGVLLDRPADAPTRR